MHDEGTGRITSGTHAGKYLNWSYDVGYWLDTAPRDAYGNVLVPYISAAADTNVLKAGDEFFVTECGKNIDAAFCTRVKQARWKIADQFTPGYGGSLHLDLYIGEEDQSRFTLDSVKFTTFEKATIAIKP